MAIPPSPRRCSWSQSRPGAGLLRRRHHGKLPAHGTAQPRGVPGLARRDAGRHETAPGRRRKTAPWAVNPGRTPNPRYPGDPELVEKYKVPVVLTSKGRPATPSAHPRLGRRGPARYRQPASCREGAGGERRRRHRRGGRRRRPHRHHQPFALLNEVRQLGDHFAIVLAGGQTTDATCSPPRRWAPTSPISAPASSPPGGDGSGGAQG